MVSSIIDLAALGAFFYFLPSLLCGLFACAMLVLFVGYTVLAVLGFLCDVIVINCTAIIHMVAEPFKWLRRSPPVRWLLQYAPPWEAVKGNALAEEWLPPLALDMYIAWMVFAGFVLGISAGCCTGTIYPALNRLSREEVITVVIVTLWVCGVAGPLVRITYYWNAGTYTGKLPSKWYERTSRATHWCRKHTGDIPYRKKTE